jgi:addiction module RelE/StbE family toxin
MDKDQAERILAKIEEQLPDKADNFPSLTGKFAGLRKFRVGDYRVIYAIIEDTALILRISHRRESYR